MNARMAAGLLAFQACLAIQSSSSSSASWDRRTPTSLPEGTRTGGGWSGGKGLPARQQAWNLVRRQQDHPLDHWDATLGRQVGDGADSELVGHDRRRTEQLRLIDRPMIWRDVGGANKPLSLTIVQLYTHGACSPLAQVSSRSFAGRDQRLSRSTIARFKTMPQQFC